MKAKLLITHYAVKLMAVSLFFVLSPMKVVAQNPYLPLWEHIPDGEPYVFEDPDKPGQYRVYIYGSHDSERTQYCGREQVVWSAAVDNLFEWRYDGIIFESKKDANGQQLNANGEGDILYAPDVTMVTGKDGKKTYYLYPNNQEGGRQTMVCKSYRPDGPFEVCNWNPKNPRETEGILHFDPAVFVDDDGRVYGYWGFTQSWGAELDPTTMATLKKGGQKIENLVPSYQQDEEFRFFEASSMRKIKDKYVFIYSRWTRNGEFGLYDTNYTLAYAYGDHPLGPFTYGGTIIDGRARGTDEKGTPIPTANPTGNTHGSICEINGQWYVFYHRQTGVNEYSRQAMVAPITVKVEEGLCGKVEISEGEYTSEGFAIDGLNPQKRYPAAIACYMTGREPVTRDASGSVYSGPYVKATYIEGIPEGNPYDLRVNCNPVVNNTDGSILGYKYFNFSQNDKRKSARMLLNMKTLGTKGRIDVMIDSPWESQGGCKIGTLNIPARKSSKAQDMKIKLTDMANLSGKHSLFLVFSSPTKRQSICEIYNICVLAN